MTDELAHRRRLKAEAQDSRVVVSAYGLEGYAVIDLPTERVQELIDALTSCVPPT